jgi:hypothetical protein
LKGWTFIDKDGRREKIKGDSRKIEREDSMRQEKKIGKQKEERKR